MRRCDVLIVGGGPAGSSCAWQLHRAGLDVVLVDKSLFPRDKTCAGWITPAVAESLQLDLREYATGNTLQPITGFRTGILGGAEVHTRYEAPVSYGIRRCEFDHYLLQRCGAELRLGRPLERLERVGREWIIDGELSAPVLVGAGGHFCPVARQLGARRDVRSSCVKAQEVEFAPAAEELERGSVRPEEPELYFCDDLAGYGWCFRKGRYLNIGLGRTESEGLTRQVDALFCFLRERGKVVAEIPSHRHGHAYQLYEHAPPRLVEEGALLVGDAAGLAYPQSGEGIRPAVESGLLAAEAIRKSAACGDRSRLAGYEAGIRRRLGRPRGRGASAWLPSAWQRFGAARLLGSRWFARHVVLDRWFLHRGEPPLVV